MGFSRGVADYEVRVERSELRESVALAPNTETCHPSEGCTTSHLARARYTSLIQVRLGRIELLLEFENCKRHLCVRSELKSSNGATNGACSINRKIIGLIICTYISSYIRLSGSERKEEEYKRGR